MFLVFIDECGYQKNWKDAKNMQQQPVHVTAAVAVDSKDVSHIYTSIRGKISNLQLPHTNASLIGKGEEIKASAVDRGEGLWGKLSQLRDKVRQSYLDHSGKVTYFVVCIDKVRHKARYPSPIDPADFALKLLFERIQGFLNDHQRQGIVLIDANKREEAAQRSLIARFLRLGSAGFGISKFYGALYQWRLQMANILEVHFGNSKYSIGLQVADFVARHIYSWWKSGKSPRYPGWNYIEQNLWKYPNHNGWGFKEFP